MGIVYILVSGAAFGLLPLFARVAYDHGTEPLGLLAVRFPIAAVCLLALRLVREHGVPWPKGKVLVTLLGLGAIGYAGQSSFYFYGIDRIDVSLATVIFYCYPVMVTLAAWAVLGTRPSRAATTCLAVVVAGAALTAGQVGAGSATGVAAMLAAAAWYTVYILVSSRTVHIAGALTSLTIVMIGASVTHLAALPLHRSQIPTDAAGWWAAVGAAIVSTIIGMGFFFAGVARLAPGTAAILSTTEPVVSVLVGVLVYSESLTAQRALGAVAVLAGVAAMAHFSRTETKYISTAESISE
ncbi:MAG: DMT family transporter [Actinomycetota bacterium]